MEIKQYISEQDARQDLGEYLSRPAWLEKQHNLPFESLSADEFEIFCYLLLLKENPGDDICYYGKTGDAGRDIIHKKSDGKVELIQCKRYQQNVGIGTIREEIAKLYINIANKTILESPDVVSFFVSSDLTAPAIDLISDPIEWNNIVVSEIKKSLKLKDSDSLNDEITQLLKDWHPNFNKKTALDLTQWAKKHPALIEEFFCFKKVIDVQSIEPIKEKLDQIVEVLLNQGISLQPNFSNIPKAIQNFLSKLEEDNSGLMFTADSNSQGTVLAIQPRPGYGSETYGTLSFSNTETGRRGIQKLKVCEEEGRSIKLEPEEYEWVWASNISLPPIDGILEINPMVPNREVPIKLESLQYGELTASISFTFLQVVRLGKNEIEFHVKGGHLPGVIVIIKSFLETSIRLNFNINLGAVTPIKAKQFLLLLLAMRRGGELQIKSLQFDDIPLIIGSAISHETNVSLSEEEIEEKLEFIEYLIKINQEFQVDIRYPKIVESDTKELAQKIITVISSGRIERINPKVVSLSLSDQEFFRFIKIWRAGNPQTITWIGSREQFYNLLDQELNIGKVRQTFKNTFPTTEISELQTKAQSLAQSEQITIEFQCDGIIYEFLNWLPQSEDASTN